MTVMVTGGAGYIGSHMVKTLLDDGYGVVTLDNLSTGFRNAILGGNFIEGDIANAQLVERTLREHRISAIMHFASFIQVGESVSNPGKYYRNNLADTISLIETARACGIKNFIFSSSAAVYGEPEIVPIPEAHTKNPVNPYGRAKWMVEQILSDLNIAGDFRSVSLRYFNAAGADPSGALGERHEPESHLIPLVLQAALGAIPYIKVFGNDYDTPDGTCIRDYVHVMDLCQAHLLALKSLLNGGEAAGFNLGNGNGYSVQEVIETAKRITGREIPTIYAARRPGDPARLVADASLAKLRLGWQPQYDRLETIIAHAWVWEQKRNAVAGN